jgi:hypothetical protein
MLRRQVTCRPFPAAFFRRVPQPASCHNRSLEEAVAATAGSQDVKQDAISARVNPYGQPNGEGKFKPGNPGGPGRPKGSRNKVGNDLKAMIMNAAVRTGFIKIDENGNRTGTGVDGCEGYLMWLCLYEPRTYAGLLARILPYYITSDVMPHVASRAEIEAEFKEFGLPMGLIEHLQKAPAPLDFDEDPDPWGLAKDVAPSVAPDGTAQ